VTKAGFDVCCHGWGAGCPSCLYRDPNAEWGYFRVQIIVAPPLMSKVTPVVEEEAHAQSCGRLSCGERVVVA
jgi:hypothetical protein